jgi:O-antigen ligase
MASSVAKADTLSAADTGGMDQKLAGRSVAGVSAPASIDATPTRTKRRDTIASRLIFLTICGALITTTLAYGTTHNWALAAFALSAAAIVCLWCLDGLILRSVQISINPLQWPLLGMILLGLAQLLPLRAPDSGGLPLSPAHSLSLDPYATRLVLVQVVCLLIYFAASFIFINTSKRLRTIALTITSFGFLLAIFGLVQYLTTDGTRVYWFRRLTQSQAFGPFINRHHFAGYMELTMALPLGLLFSGAIEKYRRPLYIVAVTIMGVALIMTNSRGGMISVAAEILFLVIIAGPGFKHSSQEPRVRQIRAAGLRTLLAFALIGALIGGAFLIGGSEVFTRLIGTPTAADPTSGRTHFWAVTIDVIKAYPIFGSGLGSLGVVYTRYDSNNGLLRLEQAHNDYLQTLSDGGIIGGVLGLAFIVILFRQGFARRETSDKFRRGVATGALAGCFAVLIHSFFDFTLHTTANALLFLILACLATQDSRVERDSQRRRRRGHGSRSTVSEPRAVATGSSKLAEP